MLAVQQPTGAPVLREQKSFTLSLKSFGRSNKSEKSLPQVPGAAESVSTAKASRRSARDTNVPPVPTFPPSAMQNHTLLRRISTTMRTGSKPESDAHQAAARRNAALRERGLLPKDLSAREHEEDIVSPIVPSPTTDAGEGISQARLIQQEWRARHAELDVVSSPSFDRSSPPVSKGLYRARSSSIDSEGGAPASSAGHSDMSHMAPSLTHSVSSYAPSDVADAPVDDGFRTVANRIPAAIDEYDVLVLDDDEFDKPPALPAKNCAASPPSSFPSSSPRTQPSSSRAPPSSFARHAGAVPAPTHRQKLLSSSSLSNLRRSVVGSLSRAQRAVRGDEPRRRTGSLGSQAGWAQAVGFSSPSPLSTAARNVPIAPATGIARQSSRSSVAPSRRSRRGSDVDSAPRAAVNPAVHTHGTVMDKAAAIEDEESRRVTEAAFCY